MKYYNNKLEEWKSSGSLRSLPDVVHRGKWIEKEGQTMLNLSSNDYLGLSSRQDLRNEFIGQLQESGLLFFPVTDREFPDLYRTGRTDGRTLRARSRPAVQQRLSC